MGVRRGEDWGGTGSLPPGAVIVSSDAEARDVVTEARREGREIPVLALLGGDLCRTLGGRGDRARLDSPEATHVTCDLGSVLCDGRLHWFVAHLIARRSWWRGRVVAVMNAPLRGRWRVAPAGHPGDGRLDVLDADPDLATRIRIRRRLGPGDHVPHPEIATRRTTAQTFTFEPRLDIHLDGMNVGRFGDIAVRVEPGAVRVVV